MQIQQQTWEQELLSLASVPTKSTSNFYVPYLNDDTRLLQQAYDHCSAVTAHHSRSFYVASSLLPTDKKRAVRALYAFCRVTDDIVDDHPETAVFELKKWRKTIFSARPASHDLVAIAWADARTRYHIPRHYAEQLVNGVARDLDQTRYETFADLATYSYGVASTVGLMSMHIIGYHGVQAIPYAIKLGLALQLTNILRDVAEDWRRGRVYLPQEELAAFGLTEEVIANGQVTEEWRAFMRFQIERNRQLYNEAWAGIALLDGDGRFAISAAAGLYRAILRDIEAHDYDVFSRRSHITGWGKIRRLPMLWWQSR